MTESTPLSLLIVDDEPDMLRGLRRILRLRGFEVETVGSGAEAIDRVRQHEPHGILMDILMPGLNGVETFRQIRAIAPNVFVIFMTAYTELMREARAEGPVDVLAKPLDLDELGKLIETAAVTRPVLVVDDEPDFLKSLSRVLTAKGFEVQGAETVEQAMAVFERQPRAVVLLDMKLGESDGLDLLRQLKQHNPLAVVVQMSGYSELHPDMEQGLTMSAYSYFTKPLNIDGLVDTLRRAMREPKKSA